MKGDFFTLGPHQMIDNVTSACITTTIAKPFFGQLTFYDIHRIVNSTITTSVGGQVPQDFIGQRFIKIIVVLNWAVNGNPFFLNLYPEFEIIDSLWKIIFEFNILVNDWLAKIWFEMILRVQRLRLARHCEICEIIIGDFQVSIYIIFERIDTLDNDRVFFIDL